MTGERMQVVRREFPDYEPRLAFEAAVTVYHLKVKAKVLERHRLSVIARFMLRTIGAGGTSTGQIARLLGLEESDLASAGVELLHSNLIEHSEPDAEGRRDLVITDQGRTFLTEEKKLSVPRHKTLRLLYDPMIREVRPDDSST